MTIHSQAVPQERPEDSVSYDYSKIRSKSTSAGPSAFADVIPVAKPDRQVWFSVRPEQESFTCYLIKLNERDEQPYLVSSDAYAALQHHAREHTLHLYVTRQNQLGLWPISTDPDNKWGVAASEVVEEKAGKWIQLHARRTGDGGYDTLEPKTEGQTPAFPEGAIEAFIPRAFPKERFIQSEDHPVAKRLLGDF